MNISPLNGLQQWYQSNCDGDWEHSFGIKISTIDNPGWAIDIALQETLWEEVHFEPIVVDRDENDWINCRIINGVFSCRCGPGNLHEALEIFQRLVSDPLK